jgi:alpha-beta hydrolase superfamily lysophospholipase
MSNSFPANIAARDGTKLITHHWPLAAGTASKGVILLVHGHGEHVRRYAHVAAHLNQLGWSVVGYDHRGHGLSEGQRGGLKQPDDYLYDLAQMIDTTRSAYPGQKLVLLSHSLGGLIAARFVAATATPAESAPWTRPVDGLILSSPALLLNINAIQQFLLNTVAKWLPDFAVPSGLKADWVSNDPNEVKKYLADPNVHDRITGKTSRFMIDAGALVRQRAANWTVPTLLLWAGSDKCVAPAGSAEFSAKAPKNLVTSQPFGHMAHEIFNEPDREKAMAPLGPWLKQVFGT